MLRKLLLTIAVLGLSVASAKTFEISLSSPAMAGKVQLQPGTYQLKLDGSKAIFTDTSNHHKTFETNVKVENSPQKSSVTAVETRNDAGVVHIEQIQLQGTKLKLIFN